MPAIFRGQGLRQYHEHILPGKFLWGTVYPGARRLHMIFVNVCTKRSSILLAKLEKNQPSFHFAKIDFHQ